MSYKYETHLHTFPVSRCGCATVRETVEHYKKKGFDGIFITNHFLHGNLNMSFNQNYEDIIRFFFSDYRKAKALGEEIGLQVFPGAEISYLGTDFLVYGLGEEWWLAHPETMEMPIKKLNLFLRENGALVIQAHPFREDSYIDHIRLFPDCVDGVEVINAGRDDRCNRLADNYAGEYHFLKTAGTDNHNAGFEKALGYMECEERITSVSDFIRHVKTGDMKLCLELQDV